jgi:hypothetical protein
LIVLTVVLATGGGVAAAVAALTGGGDKPEARSVAAVRPGLPSAERLGGYLTGSAASSSSRASGQGESDVESELSAGYALRAYPRRSVTASRALAARSAFTRLPLVLSRAAAPNATSKLGLTSQWQLLGPTLAQERPNGATNLPNRPQVVSGRVTAIAIGGRCVPGACLAYIGSAGGGVFRTDDALASKPVWRSVSDGLTSISVGSLTLDSRDASGNTLYAGTGNASSALDSEAGLGIFKTTDGGTTWSLLPGSAKLATDRSVSSIVLDPRRPGTIYAATSLSLHGASSTPEGTAPPPGAEPLGVYRSTDGGKTFDLLFRAPAQITWQGQLEVALDPNDPDSIFVAVSGEGSGQGLYRRSEAADGDTSFHLIFRPSILSGGGVDFVKFALADLGQKTRVYLTDSDTKANPGEPGEDPLGSADVYRLDDAAVPTTDVLVAHAPGSSWKKLSSSSVKDAGYAVYRYCQQQCWYSNLVASPPGRPNEVWLGGAFDYYDRNHHPRDWNDGRAVLRSTDAGATWNDMTGDTETPPLLTHPDQHAIAFSPDDPGVAFIGSDGGLVRTSGTYVDRSAACPTRTLPTNENRLCTQLLRSVPQRIITMNGGLSTLQFQSISISPPGQPLELLGGTQDNGTWSYSERGGWISVATGDGGQSVVGTGPSPPHIHTYHGAAMRVNYDGFNPAGWRAIYGPFHIQGGAGVAERRSFYVPLISDATSPGTLFVGLQHVWRTNQYGGGRKTLDRDCVEREEPPPPPSATCGQWLALGQDLTGPTFGTDRVSVDGLGRHLDFLGALARAPGDSGTLWAATTPGRVFVSQNADGPAAAVAFKRVDFSTPSLGSTKGTPGRFVSGIVVDPADPLHAWVAYSGYSAYTPRDQPGHVFEVRYNAATGESTWTNQSFDLGDEPITGLARDAQTGDLYAATDFGVLRLPAGAAAWTRAAQGLPYVAVYGLTMAPDNSTLYAATHGRGIWALKIH